MSFKIQVKIMTRQDYNNSNVNYEWHDVHPTGKPPYEYDTYEEADKMIDIIKHENWDRDKYRVFEYLTQEEKNEKFFENFDFPNECPCYCKDLIVTIDPFSTGDSPTEYDCDATIRQQCPMWKGDKNE